MATAAMLFAFTSCQKDSTASIDEFYGWWVYSSANANSVGSILGVTADELNEQLAEEAKEAEEEGETEYLYISEGDGSTYCYVQMDGSDEKIKAKFKSGKLLIDAVPDNWQFVGFSNTTGEEEDDDDSQLSMLEDALTFNLVMSLQTSTTLKANLGLTLDSESLGSTISSLVQTMNGGTFNVLDLDVYFVKSETDPEQ